MPEKSPKATLNETNPLQETMALLGEPSLKALAAVFDLNPVRIYTVAKQPREGEIYDRNVFNWDAIQRFVEKRLDPEKGFVTYEDVVRRALELDEEFKASDGRKRSDPNARARREITVDGKTIPERRYETFEASANSLIALRDDPSVYKIVLQTKSHTILRPVDEAGEFIGERLEIASNGKLNWKASRPNDLKRDIEDRFNGEYAKRLAEAAAKATKQEAKPTE